MAQLTLGGPPRIGVGGRWREIEEENRTLCLELRAWQSEAALAHEQTEAAVHEAAMMRLQATAAEQACQRTKDEAAHLCNELSFVREALSEAAIASATLESRACEAEDARQRLSAECSALQLRLCAHEEENFRMESISSKAELKASREESGRLDAETSRDSLKAELSVSEGRLVNRGTHVELLLRDKERLWGQLARARRSSTTKDSSKDPPETPKKATASSRSQPHAGTRPCSAASPVCRTPPKGLPRRSPSASSVGDRRPQMVDEGRLELERQVWHLQRALERERQGHEQTREALRVRCWRSPKSESAEALQQEALDC